MDPFVKYTKEIVWFSKLYVSMKHFHILTDQSYLRGYSFANGHISIETLGTF